MIDTDQFQKRTDTLYKTCRDRWKKVLEKGLPKGVSLDLKPDQILPFTRLEFQKFIWKELGLQARPCPYCRTPIDVLSMQLDHKTPLSRKGGPDLSNLQCLCKECNGSKGNFTHEEYTLLVEFMERQGASFRKRLEGVMRNGGMATMMRFFPKQKKGETRKKKTSKKQDSLYFELGKF